ncbi:hypothetical protein PDESU_01147 [Pontiella desulfatans]|uniref:PEP-CTERM protein-sorting domain-containing protein n=1 Tax=Pontiella desulfatans TaxID=2750659 RepID=A0A6C2TYR0_PONDE|nr:PEP-CTERM sorting domain-containing protein [Pontiella desulfatans]VGO12594.1 hypothetical protein PDESU_01147 [Pontiella desulfatans]
MKKSVGMILVLGLAQVFAVQAAVVTFDESVLFSTWDGTKWTGGPTGAGPQTFDVLQDGITFRLEVDASADLGNSVFAQSLGVVGGIKGWELDQGSYAVNATDNETLSYSLSIVSGIENLDTLSFSGVNMRLFGTADKVEFSDQSANSIIHNGTGTAQGANVNTLISDFTGLSTLSKANLASWEMHVTALDADNDYSWWTGAEDNIVQSQNSTRTNVNSLMFEYTTIPEPATLGLIAMTGVGLIGIRRIMM